MRVAIIGEGSLIERRILRILLEQDIKGDIMSSMKRQYLSDYQAIIFTYQNQIPNISKVLEQIVLEQSIHVIYITNTTSITEIYNLLHDIYFDYIEESHMEHGLVKLLQSHSKYMKSILYYKQHYEDVSSELETLKLTQKAKLILMKKGLSEEESHQYIIRESMKRRISKKSFVNLIIKNKIDI